MSVIITVNVDWVDLHSHQQQENNFFNLMKENHLIVSISIFLIFVEIEHLFIDFLATFILFLLY